MTKSRSGGGIASNKLVNVGVRGGSAANKVSPGAVSMIGVKQGNHASDPSHTVRGKPEPLMAGQMHSVPLGNAVATNVGAGGPGKGRTVYRTGGQGRH